MHIKRAFLLGTVVSLSIAAALGIVVAILDRFGELQVRLIVTMLVLSLFNLTSLGAAIVFERGYWRAAMIVSMGLSAVGGLCSLAITWIPTGMIVPPELGSALGVITTWAVAMPILGWLSLAKLVGPSQMVQYASRVVTVLLGLWITVLICLPMFFDSYIPFDLEWVWQLLWVLGILSALGWIAVPILVRVRGIDKELGAESTEMSLKLQCPRCMTEQTVNTGASRCRVCRLRFHIQIEEPRCPKCHYLLHQLTEPRCPECGHALNPEEIAQPVETGPGNPAHDETCGKAGEEKAFASEAD